MKKMAIFVEGFTELLFVEKLIEEIAGIGKVRIDTVQFFGKRGLRRLARVRASASDTGQEFYILIYDCQGFSSVKSDILDQYDSLKRSGYSAILGMRDVRPDDRANIPAIIKGLAYKTKTKPINIVYVLAIMETESWFLAEHLHFENIDPALTSALIAANLGFDPASDDMEQRDDPATDIDQAYGLVGLRYVKGIRTTIDAIDYENLFDNVTGRIDNLNLLVQEIMRFLYE